MIAEDDHLNGSRLMPNEVLYDISRPISPSTPVWPGDEPMTVRWTARVRTGAAANLASVHMGLHVGTHADAPYHILETGNRVHELSLDAFIGPTRVAEVPAGQPIAASDLEQALVSGPARILFRTGAWVDPARFPDRFAALSPAAAEALVAAGVLLVGTDAPSVDPFDSTDLPAHRRLLGANIPILENLDLTGVPEGVYELIALPLRIVEVDASPVRAVLRPLAPE